MKKRKFGEMDEEMEEIEDEIEDLEDVVQDLEKDLEKATELANGYLAQLQRVQADFENYQKRVQNEKGQIADIACAELISGLLATLDNFDRALESLDKVPPEDAEGVRMVYKSMTEYLQGCGLERMAAKGCQFDPNRHEAILQEESEAEDGTVLDEFQCGYSLKGRVLRPAKVKVARQSGTASHGAEKKIDYKENNNSQ